MKNSLNNFLESFRDNSSVFKLMYEGLDETTLKSMQSYARVISQEREKFEISDNELISSSMVLGFLLKSYLDREKLNRIYGK